MVSLLPGAFVWLLQGKRMALPGEQLTFPPLNALCQRELHTSRAPFNLARSVPAGSVKTVLDASNAYHSVPIREEDRHLTTFTTPWGLHVFFLKSIGVQSIFAPDLNPKMKAYTKHIVAPEILTNLKAY